MIDLAFDLFGASGPLAVLVVVIATTAAWIWAEVRAHLVTRLALGFVVLGLVGYVAYHVGWLGPQYTITYYDSALRRAAAELSAGRVAEVEAAFSDYARDSNPNPLSILSKLEAKRPGSSDAAK